jgi:ADP-heptose:LPS heptosyltransferase
VRKKVLLIRLDKIGDLICSLPVDQVLDENLYDVTWVVQKGLAPIVDLGQKKRTYIELDKKNSETSAQTLANFIKKFKPAVAISFQCPWWVNFELFKARIPVRAGVKSQWHSFLFLNKALRQKRSQALQHEFDYNMDLVKSIFDLPATQDYIYFHIDRPDRYPLLQDNYVVVHPGMMGSALNWPQSEYIKAIHLLMAQNKQVVITGTDADEVYLDKIKKEFLQNQKVIWLQSKLNFKELIQVLANAQYVIAPSTGVAHLAASVGAHVKAIFSPVTVHHPKRWAPRGPHIEIFMISDKAEDLVKD